MFLKVYKFLNVLASPALIPFIFMRLLKGKEHKTRFRERLGCSSIKERPYGEVIWFHATSVGETVSVLPLLEFLANGKDFKGTILFTSTTIGSIELLQRRILPKQVITQLCPIENVFVITKFLKFWKPDLAVFVESEFWPCIVDSTSKVCKVISLNTRMSDRSFKRWKFVKWFCRDLFARVHMFFPQSVDDLYKLNKLGSVNAEHIGNLKYSVPQLPCDNDELKSLKKDTFKRKIILFASTHSGEEEIALNVYEKLKQKEPSLLLVLIPRHPIRAKEVSKVVDQRGINYVLRSEHNVIKSSTSVYVVDTIGEIGTFFALSPITVMGGSFIDNIGGHNLIEPAKFGSVVVSGPYTSNFKNIVAEFKEHKAACFVKDEEECVKALKKLWNDEVLCSTYKKNAHLLLSKKGNMLKKIAKNILDHVE